MGCLVYHWASTSLPLSFGDGGLVGEAQHAPHITPQASHVDSFPNLKHAGNISHLHRFPIQFAYVLQLGALIDKM